MNQSELNELVRSYWEKEPCGTSPEIVGNSSQKSREWYDHIEEYRYSVEPFIHSVAQFTRWHGKRVLEIGVGAGTDHLQWARAGTVLCGVDLTQEAIDTTRTRLEMYGFHHNLQRVDAEGLPFDSEYFDLVYSWGVIHHSEHPERIIREIKRVLKPSGVFIGMMYNRYSLVALKLWVKHALLQKKPWRGLSYVLWNHQESIGTKAYTVSELRRFFESFSLFSAKPFLTVSDTNKLPKWLSHYFPCSWGFYIALRAVK